MLMQLISKAIERNDARRGCSIPMKCSPSEGRSFDQLMDSEWEELVIRFDDKKNDFVIKTACCPGGPAC